MRGAPRLAGTLHLAQAQSNRGPGGRKRDFPDAERLLKRLVAQELTLSFVPDVEQRLWRTVMRRKYQVTRNRAGEPHLHIHAQRPGSTIAPLSGEPVPTRFGGRYLVRNDRVRADREGS